MNSLERYIKQHGLNEKKEMDKLQGEGGLISDCCVNAEDVADSDCENAVRWLHGMGKLTPSSIYNPLAL